MTFLEELITAMSDLNENKVQELLNEFLSQNLITDSSDTISASTLNVMDVLDAMNKGMMSIGQRFSCFEYFVGDLIYAGEIYSQALEQPRPQLLQHAAANGASSDENKVILCTVVGDLHDIGKKIVRYTMESYGIHVIDLGVNVSPATVLEKAMEENVSVIALSAVLTLGVDSMARTISAFRESGIRNKVKFLIGGACTSEEVARKIHADAYRASPDESAKLCAEWLGMHSDLSE